MNYFSKADFGVKYDTGLRRMRDEQYQVGRLSFSFRLMDDASSRVHCLTTINK